MSDIQLKVRGVLYSGWTTARVTSGIESIAGGFELSVTDRWQGGNKLWPIFEGDECVLGIGGRKVISGYVDKRGLSYSASEHTLKVTGRDRTGDLVDCSALVGKWEFVNTPLLVFVRKLAEPFGIAVSASPDLKVQTSPPKYVIDPGETAFEAIEKACRKAGVLPISDGNGGLTLMQPGSAECKTALVEGENILAGSAEFDASARFRSYVVLGQSAGNDQVYGVQAARVRAKAEDLEVGRAARILVVRPEGAVDTAFAQRRAEWEKTVRAARSTSVSVTVQGWKHRTGELWPLNALVTLQSDRLGINGKMLISQRVFSVGPEGTTTQLTLRRPDAFKPEEVATAKSQIWEELRDAK